MRVPLLSFLVLCTGTPLFEAVEKPFNFYETPGKLPKEVVPTEYSIRVVPDIDNFTFAGSETVKLNVRSPVRQVVLNALELKIQAAFLDGKEMPTSAIRIDKETELLTLTLPQELATGDHSLALRFTGNEHVQIARHRRTRFETHFFSARNFPLVLDRHVRYSEPVLWYDDC